MEGMTAGGRPSNNAVALLMAKFFSFHRRGLGNPVRRAPHRIGYASRMKEEDQGRIVQMTDIVRMGPRVPLRKMTYAPPRRLGKSRPTSGGDIGTPCFHVSTQSLAKMLATSLVTVRRLMKSAAAGSGLEWSATVSASISAARSFNGDGLVVGAIASRSTPARWRGRGPSRPRPPACTTVTGGRATAATAASRSRPVPSPFERLNAGGRPGN